MSRLSRLSGLLLAIVIMILFENDPYLGKEAYAIQTQKAEAAAPSPHSHGVDVTAASRVIETAIAHALPARFFISPPSPSDGPPSDLQDIHFINNNTGYGITTGEFTNGSARLLRTIDGGKQWIAIRSWNGAFTSLSWTGNTGVGTLLTESFEKKRVQVDLVVTRDDGATWHTEQTMMVGGSSQTGWGIEPYAHVTANGAIWILESPEAATNGRQSPVWVSRDGGKIFHLVPLPRGTASTGGFGADASGRSVALSIENLRSRTYSILVGNDGSEWKNIGPGSVTPIYAIEYAARSQILAGGGNFAKFIISPAEEIWSLNPNQPNHPQVIWRRTAPQIGQYQPIIALRMQPDGVGYALTGGIPMGGNLPAPGPLFIIRNGGKSVVSTGVSGTAFDVLGKSVWVAGNGQGLFKSADYGVTWGSRFRPSTVHVQSVSFVNALDGYATTQFGIYHTSDGGQHWNLWSIDLKYIKGYSFDFVDPSTVYRWGLTNLYESTDGGQKWRPLHIPPLEQIDDVVAAPGGQIHMTGLPLSNGTNNPEGFWDELLISHDDRVHWNIIKDAFETTPVAIQFANASVGYGRAPQLWLKSLYQPAKLFFTTTGGSSWTAMDLTALDDTGSTTLTAYPGGLSFGGQFESIGILLGTNSSLTHVVAYRLGPWAPNSISFTSRANGWMTADGNLFHTTDGGKDFTKVWVVQ